MSGWPPLFILPTEPPKYYRQNYDFVNGERVDHKGMNKPPQHERIYEPIILPLRQPTLVETNLNGDEILIVDEPSKGLKLKCFSGKNPIDYQSIQYLHF